MTRAAKCRSLPGPLAAALLTILAVTGTPGSVGAATPSGSGSFGASPTPLPSGKARGYFSIELAPGQSAEETLLVYDESKAPETLRLTPAVGLTATNSGDAYESETGRCKGSGCWVGDLPPAVHLDARQVDEATFKVSVPPDTRPGQYLAGVTTEPNTAPRSVLIGRHGHAAERAVILSQVTVGVAVTVGPLRNLVTKMRISTISGSQLETLPRLNMQLANTGQTFSHGTGSVSCKADGKTVRYPVSASTILPGQQAAIPVNAQAIGFDKTVPCTARLTYGHDQVATWSGLVRMPSTVQPTKTYHTGNGVYTSLPAHNNGIPGWAIAVIVIGSLCLLGMAGLAFWILRRGGLSRA